MGYLDSSIYNQYTNGTGLYNVLNKTANGTYVLGPTYIPFGPASQTTADLAVQRKKLYELNTTLKQDDKDIAAAIKAKQKISDDWYAAHPGVDPNTATLDALAAAQATIVTLQTKRTKDTTARTAVSTKIKDLEKKLKSLNANYKPSNNQNIKPKSDTQVVTPNPPTRSYTFNAPMVKNAYFTSPGKTLQELMTEGYYLGIGAGDDALNFWKDNNGGRGTLQMDASATSAEAMAQQASYLAKTGNISEWDANLYGYKFSYNPTAITMSWGAVASADPVFASSDSNPSIPVAQNLLQSYIDFNFYVNRIEDFNYINEKGYNTGFGSFSTSAAALRDQVPTTNVNPYPVPVSISDAVDIYQKGTMYDIDWIFKVLHGGTGFASKVNKFGIKTSDVGWLPFRMTELHLGASLRYRVRITNLTVDHLIFNARMVPVLSKVTMTCARYWDGASSVAGEAAVAAAAAAAKKNGGK